MQGSEVVALFRLFETTEVHAWAAGGWAVDALFGRRTREHGDLDLAVDHEDLSSLLRILRDDGFVVTVDWSPSRLELTAEDGRTVDVHPVVFAVDGSGLQAGHGGESFSYSADGFTSGSIDGYVIPCLSAHQQLRFREGYEPRPVDDHDIALLRGLRGISTAENRSE